MCIWHQTKYEKCGHDEWEKRECRDKPGGENCGWNVTPQTERVPDRSCGHCRRRGERVQGLCEAIADFEWTRRHRENLTEFRRNNREGIKLIMDRREAWREYLRELAETGRQQLPQYMNDEDYNFDDDPYFVEFASERHYNDWLDKEAERDLREGHLAVQEGTDASMTDLETGDETTTTAGTTDREAGDETTTDDDAEDSDE